MSLNEKNERLEILGAPKQFQGVFRQLCIIFFCLGLLLWSVWASHEILTLKQNSKLLVKVQLAELVREFVSDEARSGAAPDRITAETAAYLKALSNAVHKHSTRGETVLLANAVVGGDVPDITAAVRGEVYSHIPHPQPSQAPDVPSQMSQMFQDQPKLSAGAKGE